MSGLAGMPSVPPGLGTQMTTLLNALMQNVQTLQQQINAISGNTSTSSNSVKSINDEKGSYTLSSGVLTLDCSSGDYFAVSLVANVTSVVFANAPGAGTPFGVSVKFTQDSTGGRTVGGWPSSTVWPGGTVASIKSTANAVTVITGLLDETGTPYLGKIFP